MWLLASTVLLGATTKIPTLCFLPSKQSGSIWLALVNAASRIEEPTAWEGSTTAGT